MRRIGSVLVLGVMLAGCTRLASRDDAFVTVAETTTARLHQALAWPRAPTASEAPVALAGGTLTRAQALRIALRDNPDLQARCEALGIALADHRAAGQLSNPVVGWMTRVPDRAPHGLNIEFEILANLLEVLQCPARVRAQSLAVDDAVTTLSAAILNFATEVDLTHFTLQAALHKAALLAALATTAHRTATAAATLQRAGGLDRLSMLNQALLAMTAAARVRKADLALVTARNRYARVLGHLDSPSLPLPASTLPSLPATPSQPEFPATLAQKQRLDLAAERQALAARAAHYQLTLDWRWWSTLQLGLSAERGSDGQFVSGPRIEIALPLFDHKTPELERAAAELRQAQQQLAGHVLDIQNEALLAAATVRQRFELARHYREQALPLQRALEATVHAQAQLGIVSRVELLTSQRAATRATIAYIDALRDYWLAEASLRRSLGGGDTTGLVAWDER